MGGVEDFFDERDGALPGKSVERGVFFGVQKGADEEVDVAVVILIVLARV